MRTRKAAMAAVAMAIMLAMPALAGCGSTAPGPAAKVSFVRVRLEASTTAEGLAVEVADTSDVLTSRLLAASGPVSGKGASMQRAWVRRARLLPETEEPANLTVEWALPAIAAGDGFELSFVQRGQGSSTARLTGASGDDARSLSETTLTGEGSDRVTVTPEQLSMLLTETAPLEQPTEKKTAWAFYYPWYGSQADWDSDELSDRPAHPYTSDDAGAMERHIKEAKSAGLDGFISSWWGPGSYTDENLRTLLDVARRNDFKVSLYFETLARTDEAGASAPLEGRDIYGWLRYAISTYRDHPAFMKIDGRPMIVLWASNGVELETWAEVFERLRSEGLDAFYIGHFASDSPDVSALEVYDGLHTYNVLNVVDNTSVSSIEGLSKSYETTGRGVNNYHLLGREDKPRLWAATAEPGYDDHLIPGRSTPALDRDGGGFYDRTFTAAAESDPDMLFITSWNEWWEHTYIEPSEEFGTLFLDMTRSLCERWKSS